MKKSAIKVMLSDSQVVLFIIEGFNKKEVSEPDLRRIIFEHWEYMYGTGNVIIELTRKDYIVTVFGKWTRVTWSWVTSYIIE